MFKEANLNFNLTLPEVQSQINDMYEHVDSITKVKLKCWLYYSEGRHEGGKKTISFTNYEKQMRGIDYLELVKTKCVVCDDIGTLKEVVGIITEHFYAQE